MMDESKARLRKYISLPIGIGALGLTGWVAYSVVPNLPGLDKVSEHGRLMLAYVLCGWAIIPPTWFFLEWVYLCPKDPDRFFGKTLDQVHFSEWSFVALASREWSVRAFQLAHPLC